MERNLVGYKKDYQMHPMDFEEFLCAKGYQDEQIEEIYQSMNQLKPLSNLVFNVMNDNFKEYLVLSGMSKVVSLFIEIKTLVEHYLFKSD